ncbi:acyl-CoA dehydrogenase [Nocardia sp. 852002-20019_SCH5090214]|uniref:acyl-CoA dehydrogenase family protein n=1 Tax=Nocardia sp. 852002-20019_SCH5090214 TaxID=1834087 RepID=UPI0007EACAA8|nr:acyl-CoA dehydrogenase family protein [Nocardia sp. 852002-20019_SCH5090214]OBA66452.1 acyl-CoA dehydrogenase [Nocardia sp. 852002-20019_SCH5090214]
MTYPNTELVAAVADMIDRIGIDTTTPAIASDRAVWDALAEAGFTEIGIPETQGGSGGTSADALSVAYAAAERGAITLLIEHSLLASPLLAHCTGTAAAEPSTVVIADDRCSTREVDGTTVLDGIVTDVVHGRDAARLVVLLEPPTPAALPSIAIVATDAPGVQVQPGTDLLGAALDDYRFDATPVDLYTESPVGATELEQRGAQSYTVALAAVAGSVRDATLRYAGERTQFGRPLAKFQAIQQRLAGLAARAALMQTAATAAAEAAESAPRLRRASIAAAKAVTSASAREVAAAGHQIHGAIGFTTEHSLGRFTTALWAWRDRYGSEDYWADVLAGQILDEGTDLWDAVVGAESAGEPTVAEGNSR